MCHTTEDTITLSSYARAASPDTPQASEGKSPSCLHRAWHSAEHLGAGKGHTRDEHILTATQRRSTPKRLQSPTCGISWLGADRLTGSLSTPGILKEIFMSTNKPGRLGTEGELLKGLTITSLGTHAAPPVCWSNDTCPKWERGPFK